MEVTLIAETRLYQKIDARKVEVADGGELRQQMKALGKRLMVEHGRRLFRITAVGGERVIYYPRNYSFSRYGTKQD